MAVSAVTSIKKVIGYKVSTKKDSETSVPTDDSLALVPTVGFRVGYKMGTTKLQVRVLGARHLPAKVGMAPVSGYTVKIEEKNSQLEVTLCYYPGNPEEGETDTLTIGVSKLRWSIQTTREYEQKNALLYVKLDVLEDGVRSIKSSKTRRFSPSISVHFQPDKDKSTLSLQLPPNRESLICRFSLCTKPNFGKKLVFGRVVVGPGSEQWDKAFQTPTLTRTQWHSIR
ncbi:hypothetical protein Cfor_05867 [Coptotermes formosanus]|uniref:Uncharacterized protein n=1 Tax=Coptotermes formosanus TaxID=36987 RepID=A0A6L2PCY3_COPFO|nr:hypothetical protein Cfor_05867 [Coptotermes formosanus]